MPDIDVQKNVREKQLYILDVYAYIICNYIYICIWHHMTCFFTSNHLQAPRVRDMILCNSQCPRDWPKAPRRSLAQSSWFRGARKGRGAISVGPGKAEDLYAYLMSIYIHIHIYSTYMYIYICHKISSKLFKQVYWYRYIYTVIYVYLFNMFPFYIVLFSFRARNPKQLYLIKHPSRASVIQKTSLSNFFQILHLRHQPKADP